MWPMNQMRLSPYSIPSVDQTVGNKYKSRLVQALVWIHIYYKLLPYHITKSCSVDGYGCKCTEKVIPYESPGNCVPEIITVKLNAMGYKKFNASTYLWSFKSSLGCKLH